MEILTSILLWFSAISVAIMAGIYFTFSVFLMRSLDAIEAPAGMLAMQSINRVIVRSLFLPIFFASTLSCAALAGFAAMTIDLNGALYTLLGSSLYVVGMFIVTVGGNVPLNNRLEATDVTTREAAAVWSLYLKRWTAWNHVRTLACTGSLILLVCALVERG